MNAKRFAVFCEILPQNKSRPEGRLHNLCAFGTPLADELSLYRAEHSQCGDAEHTKLGAFRYCRH
jgi:hypothetical protein